MTSINSHNYRQPHNESQNIGVGKIALGIAGGAATGFVTLKTAKLPVKKYVSLIIKHLDNFTPEENCQLMQKATAMLKKSRIKEKGFNGIIFIEDSLNPKSYITNFFKKMHDMDILPKTMHGANKTEKVSEIQNMSLKDALSAFPQNVSMGIKNGPVKNKIKAILILKTKHLRTISDLLIGKINKKNIKQSLLFGCFEQFGNKIYTGKPASIFHEIGHAINKNKNFLTRIPSAAKNISFTLLTPLTILNAVFTRKPKDEESQDENKGLLKKTSEFMHKHVGLTIAGLQLPLLFEEAMATTRAKSFINKSDLSDHLKSQHSKGLHLAFGSYLISTFIFASTVQLVTFVKDKIVENNS